MKKLVLLLCALTLTVSVAQTKKAKDKSKKVPVNEIIAEIYTSKGKIALQLEYVKTPITVANFITLAEGTNTFVTNDRKGKPYYNGLKFHRVIANFMIQGGCQLGNGSSDPGYKFQDEFDASLRHDKAGILSMANSGPATNGSQFFITHKETPWLNDKHSIFGHVIEGQAVVDAIAQDDVIEKVVIIRKGKLAKKFDAVKVFADYMKIKPELDKKAAEEAKIKAEAAAKLEAERRQKEAEAKAIADAELKAKLGTILAAKVAEFKMLKAKTITTPSGLQYSILKKGSGVKPTEGKDIYVHYAGYLEDGTLFDSSYESINKLYGKFDQNRANQNGYQPFPFKYGNKGGLIPGFLEGINNMNFNDKAIFFIPANLGYGAKGAGNVIPPNSNIIFEVEILESLPTTK
ncbi:peptidylprolyl isomerase [Flavobacterium difficile]|uniref:peptidylprolyl isomerase n=1 Tax=Flavobacterium difficile TaxID=2709659 RepID=A0ABX0I4Y0_9FLAO|nr:peptidylprolyl isomerase [Flavobacterium difficile]NHM01183.1 peptidylprolyl isomerase [Flavobacterium difficile]